MNTFASIDLQLGAEVLDILLGAGLKISVALWLELPEYGDWRLLLAGKSFDALDLREAYRLLNATLHSNGIGVERTPIIMIFRMSDPFVKALRRQFAKSKFVEGMRLGGQMIGDRFVEEGYVYRIS